MTARDPRYEVARTDAGWLARFIAANGREVWRTSETYRRKAAAERAIEIITGATVQHMSQWSEVYVPNRVVAYGIAEVRYLDERPVA